MSLNESEKMERDLVDLSEERYLKLKNIAIKLKKQLSEQKTITDAIKQENIKLIEDRDIQKSKYNNVQILQGEIDKMQDLLELKMKELKHCNSEVIETAKQLGDTKLQLTDSYQVNDSLLVAIKECEKKSVQLEKDVENLNKVNLSLENKLSSNGNELMKLKKDNSVIQKELTIEMNALKQSYDQHSSSDLLAEKEKELNFIQSELDEKNRTIHSMKNEISDEKENINSLKEQVILVNEKAKLEFSRAESLMVTVTNLRNEISKLNDIMEPLLEENKTDKAVIDSIKKELENEKLGLIEANQSSSISEKALLDANLGVEKKTKELEDIVFKLKQEKLELKEEISTMKTEFEAYKARAQSVLKKKTNISDDEYSQLVLEHQQLNSQLKDAENTVKQLKSELSTSRAEAVLLRSEKNNMSKLNKSTNDEIFNLKVSFHKEIDILKEKLIQESKENRQLVDTVAMHTEIGNKFKLEIESIKTHDSLEINALKEKIKLLECSQTEVKMISLPNIKSGFSDVEPCEMEDTKFDFSSMVREDGEGSESVEPSHIQQSHLYRSPTLEHLINNPLPLECRTDDDTVSSTTEISFSEFNKMETKAFSLERSIHHLSNLLSESEAENVKLNQLCDVLKEDIRNVSRREEREKHLENNEYFKNVLLKFLHLRTGQEKKRLVPVLQTILQLSPKEVDSLMQLAAGDKLSEESSGWSSYLHMWSNN